MNIEELQAKENQAITRYAAQCGAAAFAQGENFDRAVERVREARKAMVRAIEERVIEECEREFTARMRTTATPQDVERAYFAGRQSAGKFD